MSQRDKTSDAQIDDLVRAASERATDEDALARAVFDTLDNRHPWRLPTLPHLGPSVAAAGFAAMLLSAGLAGYAAPGLVDEGADAEILLLATGDPGVIDGSLLLPGAGVAQ